MQVKVDLVQMKLVPSRMTALSENDILFDDANGMKQQGVNILIKAGSFHHASFAMNDFGYILTASFRNSSTARIKVPQAKGKKKNSA